MSTDDLYGTSPSNSAPRPAAGLMLALCLLAWSSCNATGAPIPTSFSAEYVLRAHSAVIGTARWSLTSDGNGGYVYEISSSTAGILALLRQDRIVEHSEGKYHQRQPRPTAYRYTRSGGKKDRDVSIDFDWDSGVAHNTVKGQTWKMPIPEGTLDKLVYRLALMRDLKNGRRELTYKIADGGKIKTYDLQVLGVETLDTAIGPLETVKVRRLRKSKKRETTFWCAPSLHYLPVQMEHTEKDGSTISAFITSEQGLKLTHN